MFGKRKKDILAFIDREIAVYENSILQFDKQIKRCGCNNVDPDTIQMIEIYKNMDQQVIDELKNREGICGGGVIGKMLLQIISNKF